MGEWMRVPRQDRVRVPPRDGFSWVDRRFVREFAPDLSSEAVLLYFFLASVSDKSGLSWYGLPGIAQRTGLEGAVVLRARRMLQERDLIAFEAPVYQVLTLPKRLSPASAVSLGDLFAQMAMAREGGAV